MLYEGGTRVVALASWPGHVPAGSVVDPVLSEGRLSPRTEVVYDIEPFRAAVREGAWKLVSWTGSRAMVGA